MPDEPDITHSIELPDFPAKQGVYLVTDDTDRVLYIGSGNYVRRRIAYLIGHIASGTQGKLLHGASKRLFDLQRSGRRAVVHFLPCVNFKQKERELIQKYQPPWNKRGGGRAKTNKG